MSSKPYRVYIVECSDGTFYTGVTTNIERRIEQHNKGIASKYTRGRLPVRLRFLSCEMSHSDALKLERRIKKYPRKTKSWMTMVMGR